MNRDSLGNRMKQYEAVPKNHLVQKTPVIIRIDGKAFHTLTRGMERPFDKTLINAMWDTTKYLCANIQGAKLAYVQSDEISILLVDYENVNTSPWFDYSVQKMTSISASLATLAFNRALPTKSGACFDSRVFNIPKEEVCNYFIWRQQDCTRNSVQMVARAHFSHSKCNNKSCDELQEMLWQEAGINWNDLPVYEKRGACATRELYLKGEVVRSHWVMDENIPIFTQDRNFIDKFVYGAD